MSDITMNSMLGELRRLAAMAGAEARAIPQAGGEDFSVLFKTMLDNVNQIQQEAKGLARDFELGDERIDLAQVMIAGQKARLSFQATLQVRNKLVAAYQDIMNMPI